MEKIVRQTLLYDFYGELLTSHQKEIYEDAVLGDLSLSEIAEAEGISRQGVHDIIRRCDVTMEKYEEKLHLIEKFAQVKTQVELIRSLASANTEQIHQDVCCEMAGPDPSASSESAAGCGESGRLRQISVLCDELLEML